MRFVAVKCRRHLMRGQRAGPFIGKKLILCQAFTAFGSLNLHLERRHMKTERPWWEESALVFRALLSALESFGDFRKGSGQPITLSGDTSPAAAVGNQVMRDRVSTDTGRVSMRSLQVVFAFQSSKYLWSDDSETVQIWIESDHLPEQVSKVQIRFLTDVEKECGLYSN